MSDVVDYSMSAYVGSRSSCYKITLNLTFYTASTIGIADLPVSTFASTNVGVV